MNDDTPVTKADLTSAVTQIREYIDQRTSSAEKHLIEYVDERTRDMQTELLKALRTYQESIAIRFGQAHRRHRQY